MQHAIKIDILFVSLNNLHRQLFQMLINVLFLNSEQKAYCRIGLPLVNIYTRHNGPPAAGFRFKILKAPYFFRLIEWVLKENR